MPKLRSPVKADYSGHSGPVHDLSSSPFQASPPRRSPRQAPHAVSLQMSGSRAPPFPRHVSLMTPPPHCMWRQRNIFASCGADGTLCVYNMLQVTPVMKLEPSEAYLFGCRWSPFRPLVLAAAAGDGQVFLYDLNQSILHPVKAIGCSEQARRRPAPPRHRQPSVASPNTTAHTSSKIGANIRCLLPMKHPRHAALPFRCSNIVRVYQRRGFLCDWRPYRLPVPTHLSDPNNSLTSGMQAK